MTFKRRCHFIRSISPPHIQNTPKGVSPIGALSAADIEMPSTIFSAGWSRCHHPTAALLHNKDTLAARRHFTGTNTGAPFFLDQKYEEFCWLCATCVSANDMNIVRTFVKGLTWCQRDFLYRPSPASRRSLPARKETHAHCADVWDPNRRAHSPLRSLAPPCRGCLPNPST